MFPNPQLASFHTSKHRRASVRLHLCQHHNLQVTILYGNFFTILYKYRYSIVISTLLYTEPFYIDINTIIDKEILYNINISTTVHMQIFYSNINTTFWSLQVQIVYNNISTTIFIDHYNYQCLNSAGVCHIALSRNRIGTHYFCSYFSFWNN